MLNWIRELKKLLVICKLFKSWSKRWQIKRTLIKKMMTSKPLKRKFIKLLVKLILTSKKKLTPTSNKKNSKRKNKRPVTAVQSPRRRELKPKKTNYPPF